MPAVQPPCDSRLEASQRKWRWAEVSRLHHQRHWRRPRRSTPDSGATARGRSAQSIGMLSHGAVDYQCVG
jgi:hypothetical protein